MYRKVTDFINEWTAETEKTKQVLQSITDEKLDQSIAEGHNTLGWLGWHLAVTPTFLLSQAGIEIIPVGKQEDEPKQVKEIQAAYEKVADSAKQAIEAGLTDESLLENVNFLSSEAPRGAVLRTLINHQTHHRGEMVVLLRQAGLEVPGLYGPTKEQMDNM
ncbi:putative damage-inducible protein DinB [Geomicrobium halophilum]|uniref:Putative damage-inducible protein DinB n=1 Tax=Geomicrobium halophilum TaxID=549000 RepID=A0A841PZK1_9BACL|nr:DinB family protein [Geomicrobium halophilum]MBB6450413.1 putative damage-inducible protein DinB [Geomicrobium halophilum]